MCLEGVFLVVDVLNDDSVISGDVLAHSVVEHVRGIVLWSAMSIFSLILLAAQASRINSLLILTFMTLLKSL